MCSEFCGPDISTELSWAHLLFHLALTEVPQGWQCDGWNGGVQGDLTHTSGAVARTAERFYVALTKGLGCASFQDSRTPKASISASKGESRSVQAQPQKLCNSTSTKFYCG